MEPRLYILGGLFLGLVGSLVFFFVSLASSRKRKEPDDAIAPAGQSVPPTGSSAAGRVEGGDWRPESEPESAIILGGDFPDIEPGTVHGTGSPPETERDRPAEAPPVPASPHTSAPSPGASVPIAQTPVAPAPVASPAVVPAPTPVAAAPAPVTPALAQTAPAASAPPAKPAPVAPAPVAPAPAAPAPVAPAPAAPAPAELAPVPPPAPAAPAEVAPAPVVCAAPAPYVPEPPVVVPPLPSAASVAVQPPAEARDYVPVSGVELTFDDGSAPVGVRPGTRTFEEFQRAAAALFADLNRAAPR